MHKTESVTKTVTETIHHFYCDGCGKLLGSTKEHDDGWYGQHGFFYINWLVPENDWFKLNKHFCEKCKQEFCDKLRNSLESFGFVKDD